MAQRWTLSKQYPSFVTSTQNIDVCINTINALTGHFRCAVHSLPGKIFGRATLVPAHTGCVAAQHSAAQRKIWKTFHYLHRAAALACCVNTLLDNNCFHYLHYVTQTLRCAYVLCVDGALTIRAEQSGLFESHCRRCCWCRRYRQIPCPLPLNITRMYLIVVKPIPTKKAVGPRSCYSALVYVQCPLPHPPLCGYGSSFIYKLELVFNEGIHLQVPPC